MEAKEVIDIITHYRHDILNQLQVIQGYIGMGKPEIAEEKMLAYINLLEQERRLTNLGLPEFAYWLISFNMIHTNFRLSYTIESGTVAGAQVNEDRRIMNACRKWFETVQERADSNELYKGHVRFYKAPIDHICNIDLEISGCFLNMDELEKQLQQGLPSVIVHKEEKQLVCKLTFERDE